MQISEGLRAKRTYIGFWLIFTFCRLKLNFWQTDLFWPEKHRSVIFLVNLRFILQNRPFPSSLVPLFQSESKCETILTEMTFICMKMKLHAELIFIWKVSHLDSFWDRGTRELWSGLLTYAKNLSPLVEWKTKETFCSAKFYYSHNYTNQLLLLR